MSLLQQNIQWSMYVQEGGQIEREWRLVAMDPPSKLVETAATEQKKDRAEHVHPTHNTTSKTLHFFFP